MDKELLKHLTLCFDKPPEEAVEYLKSKKIKVTWNWQERLQAIKEHSFTVSKASSADVLQLFKDELVKSVETGTTFNDFKKSIKEKLKTAGFSKNAEGKAWRLDTIYRMNTQTAYMAGRYIQQKEVEETFPYWKIIAVLDNHTTDICSGLNNKVVKASDKFWNTHTPPLHYKCRSRTIAVDDDYLKKNNLQVSDGEELAKRYPPAKGFDNNPVDAWKPDLSKYDKEIKNELGKVLRSKKRFIEKLGNVNEEELERIIQKILHVSHSIDVDNFLKNRNNYLNNLDDKTKDALNDYMDMQYKDINKDLREGNTDSKYYKKGKQILDGDLNFNFKEETILYRGINFNDDIPMINELQKGIYKFNDLQSTSLNSSQALFFSDFSSDSLHSVVFVIKTNENFTAGFGTAWEKEIILRKDDAIEIDSIKEYEYNGKKKIIIYGNLLQKKVK